MKRFLQQGPLLENLHDVETEIDQLHLVVPRSLQHYLWEWGFLEMELAQALRQILKALLEQPLPQSQLPLQLQPLPLQAERWAAQRIRLLLGLMNLH